MTWLKTDDGEWCAPWVSIVGPAAYGVYKRLEGYCAQHETDGLVPKEFVAMVVGSAGQDGDQIVDVLQTLGRAVPAEIGGGLRLPFFLDHNPTRAQLEADRLARKSRAQKAAAARWDARS